MNLDPILVGLYSNGENGSRETLQMMMRGRLPADATGVQGSHTIVPPARLASADTLRFGPRFDGLFAPLDEGRILLRK